MGKGTKKKKKKKKKKRFGGIKVVWYRYEVVYGLAGVRLCAMLIINIIHHITIWVR